jgi:orotidine-5'-phosphate decarboxylase
MGCGKEDMMEEKPEAPGRIIIALDVKNKEEALVLVSKIKDAQVFKIGLELYTAEGPSLFKKIKALRKKIFLDLKLHDIPNTVAGAVRSGVRHQVEMMTLHTSGGYEMLARAAEAAASEAEKIRVSRPVLLGVTILTSLKSDELKEIGMAEDVLGQVARLAALARKAGLDGVVCSPQEIEAVRKENASPFLIVTPGIRPAWASAQDQKRIMTPSEALAKGADFIVLGRPVTEAASPREAFSKVVAELERAVHSADRENRP